MKKNQGRIFMRSALVLLFLGMSHAAWAFDHTHDEWDKWLKKFVTVKGPVSTVDYKAAKGSNSSLPSYLTKVAEVKKDEYQKFTDPQKLAFLINAYNAYTVKLIVDNYPVKSIKDLGGTFSSPWKKKFFKLFQEEQNLDGIEHGMIREQFNEPRIHFSVVCASKGCPALRNEAFRAEKLEDQLEAAAVGFLKDAERNRFNAAKNEFEVSKIFDWYGGDFKKKFETVQNFLAPRMGKTPAEVATMKKADVEYLDYDWTLNETGSARATSGSR